VNIKKLCGYPHHGYHEYGYRYRTNIYLAGRVGKTTVLTLPCHIDILIGILHQLLTIICLLATYTKTIRPRVKSGVSINLALWRGTTT